MDGAVRPKRTDDVCQDEWCPYWYFVSTTSDRADDHCCYLHCMFDL